MDKPVNKNENSTNIGQYAALQNDLEALMKHVKDDMDIARITRTLSEMERLHPVQPADAHTSADAGIFTGTILPRAVAEREAFLQTTGCYGNTCNDSAKKRGQRFPKTSAAAIALLVLLIGSSIAVMATRGVFEPIVQWVNGQLIIRTTEDDSVMNNMPAISTIIPQADVTEYGYEGIDAANTVVVLKPNYIPDGYILEEIAQTISSRQTDYSAYYSNGDTNILYSITLWPNGRVEGSQKRIEIIPGYALEFDHNGIHYYVFQNTNWFGAAWTHHNIDYDAAGFESVEEVIKFLENLNY